MFCGVASNPIKKEIRAREFIPGPFFYFPSNFPFKWEKVGKHRKIKQRFLTKTRKMKSPANVEVYRVFTGFYYW